MDATDGLDRDPLCDNCPKALRPADAYTKRRDWRLFCCKDERPMVYFSRPQDPDTW